MVDDLPKQIKSEKRPFFSFSTLLNPAPAHLCKVDKRKQYLAVQPFLIHASLRTTPLAKLLKA